MHSKLFERLVSLWDKRNAPDLSKTITNSVLYPKLASRLANKPFLQLPVFCCQAAGGDPALAESISDAWGILYFAAWLLDSAADGEIPASEIGVSNTLAAACISSSSLLLTPGDPSTIQSDIFQAIQKDFQNVVLIACNGQINDITHINSSLNLLWQVARQKTGEFYSLASRSGARVATDDHKCIDLYSDFGLHLGMLIQIGDDTNGLWTNNNQRSDLLSGKWTLPVAYTMEVSSKHERELLLRYLKSTNTDPLAEEKARQIIIESGAMLYLVTKAQWHYEQAKSSLMKAAQPGEALEGLLGLLDLAIPKRGL